MMKIISLNTLYSCRLHMSPAFLLTPDPRAAAGVPQLPYTPKEPEAKDLLPPGWSAASARGCAVAPRVPGWRSGTRAEVSPKLRVTLLKYRLQFALCRFSLAQAQALCPPIPTLTCSFQVKWAARLLLHGALVFSVCCGSWRRDLASAGCQ